MKIENLFLVSHVLNSDEDSSVIEDLYAGYSPALNLIIAVTYTDYDNPDYNCITYAEIKKGNAYKLSRRLRVAMKDLPNYIASSLDDYQEIINPRPSDVSRCFAEILDCLVEEGCRFRIVRIQSKNGLVAC